MKVIIADDHDLVREGISHVLKRIDTNIKILHARSFMEVFTLVPENTDADFVLLDLFMPGHDSFDGLRKARELAPNVPLIVLSASEDDSDIRCALSIGVRGYIPKSASNQVMLAAIELVLSGGVYVPPSLLHITSEHTAKLNTEQETNDSIHNLTRRQKEVLKLLATGKSNKEIGRELGLSEGTIRTHLTAIFRTLNVNNRTEASHVAMLEGLTKI